MKSTDKQARNIRLAEIAVIAAVILAILLPQLIGTTDISQKKGDWKRQEELNGKTIGAVRGSELATLSLEKWPDAEMY